jgi:hypothetical protein
LKNVDDRPDIGDQNYKTVQALVSHVSIILIVIAKALRYTFDAFTGGKMAPFAWPGASREAASPCTHKKRELLLWDN